MAFVTGNNAMPKSITITRVEAIPFRIPLKSPSRWGAHGSRDAAEHVLIRVYSDNGLVGISEGIPRPVIFGETQKSITHIIDAHFAPMLIGMDIFDRQAIHDKLNTIQWNPTAKGGLDMAIHDLIAQSCELPLAVFLGGAMAPLPVSYMLPLGKLDAMLKSADEIRSQYGINAWKIKTGGHPDEDVARVRELRKAMGADAFIFIDANQTYTPEIAIRTINRMTEFDLKMVEEPVPVTLGRQRKKVADNIPVPILGDDSLFSLADARREVDAGAVGVMGLKTPRTGIWESSKIVHVAEAYGMPCWMGSQGVSQIGTLASAHFAVGFAQRFTVPADLGNYVKQLDDLNATPITLRDGCLHLPERPGIGVTIDEEKLKRYRND
jgi:L-alanine-DL-glutamate epimerase-like enolase superfamily enzyme